MTVHLQASLFTFINGDTIFFIYFDCFPGCQSPSKIEITRKRRKILQQEQTLSVKNLSLWKMMLNENNRVASSESVSHTPLMW